MTALPGRAKLGGLLLSGPTSATTVLSLAQSICSYLASVQSLGLTFNMLTAGSNLFANFLPDEPDQAVAVFERAGAAPLMTLTGTGAPTSLLEQPVFQVRVRTAPGDYTAGNTLAQQLYGALQGLANRPIPAGGMEFLLVTAAGYPAYLGVDIRQRHEWSQLYRVIMQNTQRLAA